MDDPAARSALPTPSPATPHTVRLGILGCGTVGASLVSLCERDGNHIAASTGIRPQVTAVAVRNLSAPRSVALADGVLTRDVDAVVTSPDVDVVVEAIGGIEPARHLVTAALEAKKPVVTANKELIANCGEELFGVAAAARVDLLFEAAVAGGIPLIGVLRRSLAGEPITRVMGIVNGTTNFILTKMTEEGADYADVLAQAQQLGYAEADPTADVEGFDAGAKAAILTMLAFGAKVVAGDVYREGIAAVRSEDIAAAARMGHVIKLLAVAERADDGDVSVRVHPAMVPATHPLGSVRDSFNAVFLEGPAIDDVMLYGRGAGGLPTASAMLGDVLTAARNLALGVSEPPIELTPTRVRSIDESASAYHVAMAVLDAPGVLATVASVFGKHGVSIRSMEQTASTEASSTADGYDGPTAHLSIGQTGITPPPAADGPTAHLEFITHRAKDADTQATLAELRDLPEVRSVGIPIRVIGD